MRTKNISAWLPVQRAMRTLRTAFNSDILRAMRATNITVGFNIRVKLGLIEH